MTRVVLVVLGVLIALSVLGYLGLSNATGSKDTHPSPVPVATP